MTFALAGTSSGVTPFEAMASVRYTIPASPSPSSSLATTARTLASREATLAA